jgi:hypothetical protein
MRAVRSLINIAVRGPRRQMARRSLTLGTGFLAIGLASGAPSTAVAAFPKSPVTKCAPDAVVTGPTCVDKYEASAWQIPAANTGLIKKVQKGKATLADLTAGGATQLSPTSSCTPAYPGTFPANGNWTDPVYAVSIPGVLPSACLTWFQAEQACALSGKRLLTNQEWQRAAAGTPDSGVDDESTLCNIDGPLFAPTNTGSRSACVSKWGVRHGRERFRVGRRLGRCC